MSTKFNMINRRLLIVCLLGFSSGIPYALLSSTLQAWFADAGMTVWATGMLSLLGLPYAYRMFWAPFVDKYALFALGKRRSWILSMQILLVLGFNALAWLSPSIDAKSMAVIALFLTFCSATQDIAIDAQRTEYLPTDAHGLGASLAVFGYRMALLLAGGGMLVLAKHLGWKTAYQLSGCLMLPGIFVILWSQEPYHIQQSMNDGISTRQISNCHSLFWLPVKDLFKREKMVLLLMFIFMYKLGEAFTTTSSGVLMPFLLEYIGFSLDTIAYVNHIFGLISIILGGLTAGVLLRRWSLYKSLLIFGLLQALTNTLFVLLAIVGNATWAFALAVVADNFVGGMGSTALVALLMRTVNQTFTGTQFSILVAFSTLPRILSGPLAAILQSAFGWVGLFELSVILALFFLPFLIRIRTIYCERKIFEQGIQKNMNNDNNPCCISDN